MDCERLHARKKSFNEDILRVQFQADERNARSRAALEKIGARYEGTLRLNTVTWPGHLRSSAIYSIVRPEWPAVREMLVARIEDLVASVDGMA